MISTGWGVIPLIFFLVAIFTTYTNEDYDRKFCSVYYPNSESCFNNIREQNEKYRPYFTIGLVMTVVFMLTAYITNNFFDKDISIKEKRYGIFAQQNNLKVEDK